MLLVKCGDIDLTLVLLSIPTANCSSGGVRKSSLFFFAQYSMSSSSMNLLALGMQQVSNDYCVNIHGTLYLSVGNVFPRYAAPASGSAFV